MKKRIPELDGLRFLMILIVSAYHFWQQSWLTPRIGTWSADPLLRSGYIWVDGTILLSAFLLYLPHARAGREATPEPAIDFYKRRICRIVPSYYFIILLAFFAIALPWGLYYSPQFMVKDLATHLSFTFTFWYDTYVATNLGAACWTLAIELQAYLLFPLVVRALRKKPVLTMVSMLVLCFGFRAWVIWAESDYSTVVNQLINFLDVYVLGFLLAMLYARLERHFADKPPVWWQRTLATLLFAFSLYLLSILLTRQAHSSGYMAIQRGQMERRTFFALCFGGLLISAPFSLKPLRFLLGNRVMVFLASISMNYYLIHQTLAVHLKRLGIPASISDQPHMDGEYSWQITYTLLCYGLSLILATLITLLVEKPGGKLLNRLMNRHPKEVHS